MTTKKRVFIIAEAGVNHNGDLALAKKLIDLAAEAGADAVKFQAFHSESLVTSSADKASYQSKNLGDADSPQLKMLKSLELSEENFLQLKSYAGQKKGIIFLATPFDERFADFLEPLVPLYKIGSGELTNIPLLRHIVAKKKPIILSTGMGTLEEIAAAVKVLESVPLTLLHCTTNYPCPPEEVNLKAMLTLKETFRFPVGYSDHTLGIEIPIAAAALGAEVIEKHFTLNRSLQGPDHRASLEPVELQNMVRAIRNIEKALGDGVKRPQDSELDIAKASRRSLIFSRPLREGTVLSQSDVVIKRPGTGIPPFHLPDVLGRRLKTDVEADQLISWEILEEKN